MNDDLDDRVREALRPLRNVPVPPMPRLEARVEPRRSFSRRAWAAAAAAVLAATVGVWLRRPDPEFVSPTKHLVAELDRMEERIRSAAATPLRSILEDELRLVRHELAAVAAALPPETPLK